MNPRTILLDCAMLLLGTAPALAACPPSTYLYGDLDPFVPIVMTAAAHDTTFRVQPCETMHGRYPLDAGLLMAYTAGCTMYSSSATITGLETVVEDDFTIAGLPAGTPVALDAVMALDGYAYTLGEPGVGGGRVRGLIRESAMNEVQWEESTPVGSGVNVHRSITLHLNAIAGTPVRLRFAVRGECFDGFARMEGVFRFEGLPPVAYVTSCRG